MTWDIKYCAKLQACREAWNVSLAEAADLVERELVVFYMRHEAGREAPAVVSVEYVGTDGKISPADAYKDITPIVCVKKGADHGE